MSSIPVHPLIECKLNHTARILVDYGGFWRPVFWVAARREGDIVLGPRHPRPSVMRHQVLPLEAGKATYKYGAGQLVDDPDVLKIGGKLTFHISGAINVGEARVRREPIRDLTQATFLCMMKLQHPSRFAPMSKATSDDVRLQYPFDELRPLAVQVYVAPTVNPQTVIVRSAAFQQNLSFLCTGLDDGRDRIVQVVLYHRDEARWPPETVVMVPTLKRNQNSVSQA